MFPYRDDNPTLRTPFITASIIAISAAAWLFVQGAGNPTRVAQSVCELGAIPGELLGTLAPGTSFRMGPGMICDVGSHPTWYTLITSVFLHGGWMHLISNMWFLWIFGNNVEDSMGHTRYTFFYLICGILAAAAQILGNADSRIPMVGASGAISGVMGAYLVLYPKVRVHMLVFLGFWVTTVAVPAYLMLVYWAFLQLLGSLPAFGDVTREQGGVAFLAHLGGFIAGAALIKVFARPDLVLAHRQAIAAQAYNEPWQGRSGRD